MGEKLNNKIIKVGFIVSGNGSLMEYCIKVALAEIIKAKIVFVIADRKCMAIKIAQKYGIETKIIKSRKNDSSKTISKRMYEVLVAKNIDLICLSFNKIIFNPLLGFFKNRIINAHPSLLPAFKGFKAIKNMLASGTKFAGCSVHVCNENPDGGPIIIQSVVSLLPNTSLKEINQKLYELQRLNLCQVIQWFAEDRITIVHNKAYVHGAKYGQFPTNPKIEVISLNKRNKNNYPRWLSNNK